MLITSPGNEQLWIMDRNVKPVPAIVGGFGAHGRNAGNFVTLHGLAVDSKGNLYTAETVDSGRVQKFVPTGTISTAGLPLFEGSPHYAPFPGK